MFRNIKKIQIILVSFSIVLVFSIAWVYQKFNIVTNETTKKIENIEIKNINKTARIITAFINSEIKRDIFLEVQADKKLSSKLESILKKFISDDMKYIYMIYKDKKGSYRYLIDGSKNSEEKGEFNQKFFPQSNIWEIAFRYKQDIYTYQKNIDGLWLTYLHPVFKNGVFQGVLSFDLSVKAYEELKEILLPVFSYFKYIGLLLVFIVLFITLEFYLYLHQKKINLIDPLTKLYNRNYLEDKIQGIELESIALAILDIDFFKNINDTYGHDFGDIVLETVAKRILSLIRVEDKAIRIGGEEFLIIFKKNDADMHNLLNIVKRLQKEISTRQIRVRDINMKITVSIGFNPHPELSNSLEEAIKEADKSLYKAKNSGRNRVEVSYGHL